MLLTQYLPADELARVEAAFYDPPPAQRQSPAQLQEPTSSDPLFPPGTEPLVRPPWLVSDEEAARRENQLVGSLERGEL